MKDLMEGWRKYSESIEWIPLTEAKLARVMTKYMENGFIIITSDRTCNAEMGRKCTQEEESEQASINKQNYQDLVADARTSGFGYIPALGGYKEKITDPETGQETTVDTEKPENSIIIVSRGDIAALKDFGLKIAKKYNQDSFFFKPPNEEDEGAYYLKQDGSVDMSFSSFKPEDIEQEFYTQLKKDKRRFTALPERKVFFRDRPSSVWEARRRYGELYPPLEVEGE
tara:strand:- start:1979 stop:2659 length:681 start_codon:yes stop_codon:yes gene_type:complete